LVTDKKSLDIGFCTNVPLDAIRDCHLSTPSTAPQSESHLPAIGRWLRRAKRQERVLFQNEAIDTESMKQKLHILAVATTAMFLHSGLHAQTAPVNELQAIMDIAKSPTHNVATLFNLSSPSSFFQPSLASAPSDWSLAITYAPATTGSTLSSPIAITAYSITSDVITFTASNTLTAGQHVFIYGFPTSTFLNGVAYTVSSPTTSQFTASFTHSNTSGTVTESGSALYDDPVWVALDANDNAYSANQDGVNVGGGLSALAANGTPNWTSALNPTYCEPYMVATDVNGNVWMSSSQSSGSCNSSHVNMVAFSTSSGSTTDGTPWGATTSPGYVADTSSLAFDRSSNLWIGHFTGCTGSGSSFCLYRYPYNGTSSPQYATATAPAASSAAALEYPGPILIDGNYNVWVSSSGTSSTGTPYVSVLPNSGTAAPAWTDAVISEALTEGRAFGVSMDGSNNVWATSYNDNGATDADLFEFTPTYTGATVTSVSASANNPISLAVSSSPYQGEFDGVGTYWFPSNASTGNIYYYVPATGADIGLLPCFLPGGATACGSNTNVATAGPRVVQIDSTGSIWVAASAGGQIVQIIGSAAPTWPQLSYAKFGAEPQ